MRRHTLCALILFVVSALMTQIGAQCPSIAEGIRVLAPGVTMTVVRESLPTGVGAYCVGAPQPFECGLNDVDYLWQPAGLGYDAAGSNYHFASPGPGTYRFEFDGTRTGQLLQRIDPTGQAQSVAEFTQRICFDYSSREQWTFSYGNHFQFDLTNGRILFPMRADAGGVAISCPGSIGLMELSGFPKLFDTLLTFTPGGTLSALVPGHPDGFRSAETLQVWTGTLGTMPDWSQAQPLICAAATSPSPGQLVTVVDTLPEPAPGTGRYYLSAVQHASDRRLGRQYVNRAFSARDPSTLPACAP